MIFDFLLGIFTNIGVILLLFGVTAALIALIYFYLNDDDRYL